MYINLGLFARAQYLTLFKTRFSIRRWAYVLFFTALYGLMWCLVALGRALDHVFFPGFKRQPVRQPVFIVAPPRSGTTLTQKLMSLDEERFVYNALYQTIFPAVSFQRCFDAIVWVDGKAGRPLGRLVAWAEKKWFGGWDDMHKMRFNQPEEDDGFFVYTFVTEAIFLLFLHVDELWEAGFQDALPRAKRRKVMAFYRSCLQRRLYASGPGKTILTKATQSSGSVESLLETFPDAKFITIIRHPYESVASHVSVFWPVWQAHSPALQKDGPESKAYARLAVQWFRHLFEFRRKINPEQYYCIDYRDLTRDPKAALEQLYAHFGWKMSQGFREKLALATGRQREFKSKHGYTLEEFGLSKEWIQEELGGVLEHYALPQMISALHRHIMNDNSDPNPERAPLDIRALLQKHEGRNYELHSAHVNPANVRTLKTIGFDRCYVRAEGPYLWDTQGTKYLDMLSGYGVFGLGRNHPDVRRVLTEFLTAEYPSLVKMEAPLLCGLLAEELKKRMPNQLDMVFFTNSGAEGIETAMKYARCATRRPAIVHCEKAFHGLTYGSLSLNGDENFREGFEPFLTDCRKIPFDDPGALEQELRKGDVAAFVVEPIQGKGVNIPAPGYLRECAQLCRKYGALFVDDEIQTGMGRTGRFLASEHDGEVDPDIVVLAKSLSGGFVPVGAVLCKKWIHEKVFSSMNRSVVHSSTFSQGSFAMVAGLAALDVLDRCQLVQRAERMGRLLADGLGALVPRFEFLKEIRARGLMVGIEFGPPQSLGLKAAWTLMHKMDKSLFPQAAIIPLMDKHHIITQVAGHHIDVIKLIPPLVISEEDVNWFLTAFEDVVGQMHKFPGPVWDVVSDIGKMVLTSRAR